MRWELWDFNRFLPEKPCQTGTLAKTLLLMLIDVVILAFIDCHLSAGRSVAQGHSSDAWASHTRSVRRRAASFSRANRKLSQGKGCRQSVRNAPNAAPFVRISKCTGLLVNELVVASRSITRQRWETFTITAKLEYPAAKKPSAICQPPFRSNGNCRFCHWIGPEPP